MALTPLRWAAVVVSGALLAITYFYTPPDPLRRNENERTVLAERERRLNARASDAADRLRASIIIDSLQRSLARVAGDSVRVFFGRGIPASTHELFRAATHRGLRALGSAALPVDVVFVLDTAETVRGVARGAARSATGEFVLPVSSTDRCVSIVRIRPAFTSSEAEHFLTQLAGRLSVQRLLGPCAFVAAFGRPGPHVAEWLSRGAWAYAMVVGWSELSPKWQAPAWYGGRSDDSHGWPLREYMGLDGYRCAVGDQQACNTVVLERPATAGRTGGLPRAWAGRVISASPSQSDWWYRFSLGPRQPNFLSDLVHQVGYDNFRRFWTSREPVATAFESATGRSLGDATYRWTQSQYAGYVGRGAAVPPLTAGLALLFIGGAAATAIVAARRRTVR